MNLIHGRSVDESVAKLWIKNFVNVSCNDPWIQPSRDWFVGTASAADIRELWIVSTGWTRQITQVTTSATVGAVVTKWSEAVGAGRVSASHLSRVTQFQKEFECYGARDPRNWILVTDDDRDGPGLSVRDGNHRAIAANLSGLNQRSLSTRQESSRTRRRG